MSPTRRSEHAQPIRARQQRRRDPLPIDDANSRPRTVKVVALDRPSEAVVERLALEQWNGAVFLIGSAFAARSLGHGQFSMETWPSDLSGRTKRLVDEISGADLVVMIATAGEDAALAAIIGEACSLKRVTTSALVLGGASTTDEALSRTLAQLRPWVLMLVIASTDDYIADMLRALRA